MYHPQREPFMRHTAGLNLWHCHTPHPWSRNTLRRRWRRYGIAYASFAPLNGEVFVADADGSRARPLAPDPGWDANASFSTDGQWVVFTSNRRGSADIFRIHPDGSGLERLTDDPAFDDQPALSPDGRRLAFVSTRTGRAEIWSLDLQTRALENLTGTSGGSFRPAWSPDGTWIAFSSDRASPHPVRPGSVRVDSSDGDLRHARKRQRCAPGDAHRVVRG